MLSYAKRKAQNTGGIAGAYMSQATKLIDVWTLAMQSAHTMSIA